MKIKYLYNSGFSLELSCYQLFFDYYKGPLPDIYKPAIFFASHSHPDHYTDKIFSYNGKNIVYVLSGEIPVNEASNIIKLNKGDCAEPLPGIKVTAFGSTDLGVSFMINAENLTIFHAGDYNLWHWRSESTKEEIAEAEKLFYGVLDTLKPYKDKIDLAFFPVDGRMGEGTEDGARIFAEALKPKVLIPMHFGSNLQAPKDAAHVMEKHTKYVVLAEPGAEINIGEE